jgi:N-acetylglucosamine-6-phosphate deacetylase
MKQEANRMIIQSKKIWLADQFVAGQIEIVDGKIVGIYDYDEKEVDKDYGDNRVLPGFIDIHCHGAYGFDTNDAKEDGLRYWLRNIVNEGVTALLPTTITQSEEVLTNAVANVAKVVEEGYEGAEVLGIHFEGPYLDMVYKGAQPEQHIVKPTIEQFKKYQKAANGLIKYITMATETDEDFALTRYCAENGVVVSIGHSAATYEQAVRAYAYGARSMTHVYNGMTAFNHRANGLVGGAYRIRNMYGEIICDGNHSTLAALNNYFTSKGPNYSIMVSDALMAKGSPVGSKFIFGGNEIEIYPDGSAHLTSTGGLAGSTLKLNQGLKILIEEALVPVNTAINSCTINPARCLKVDDHKGAIGVGYDGDLVVLDKDYEVIQTYCKGKEMIDGTK